MAWNDEIFREKMDKLNSSQLSIENTSQWMRFYRADARRVADCWEAYFSKADQPKRLAMVYLANDVVQNRCDRRAPAAEGCPQQAGTGVRLGLRARPISALAPLLTASVVSSR